MYNHAPDHYICPFCLLIKGIENKHVLSVQSDIIYHDNVITAFVGSHQWPHNHGNVIITPNEHFENIYDLPIHYAVDIHRVVSMIALALKEVYSCDGISTRQNNEPAGNQDVWHYHLHVTPRYKDDEFYVSQREFMPIDQRARHAQKLRYYLAEQSGGMQYLIKTQDEVSSRYGLPPRLQPHTCARCKQVLPKISQRKQNSGP